MKSERETFQISKIQKICFERALRHFDHRVTSLPPIFISYLTSNPSYRLQNSLLMLDCWRNCCELFSPWKRSIRVTILIARSVVFLLIVHSSICDMFVHIFPILCVLMVNISGIFMRGRKWKLDWCYVSTWLIILCYALLFPFISYNSISYYLFIPSFV